MSTLKRIFNHLQRELWDGLLGSDDLNTPKSATPTPPRSIVLHNQLIHYRIERARRKTVGMMVDAQGLRVRAAPRVSVVEIERILHSKSNWILKSLHKARVRAQAPAQKSFVPELNFTDGESVSLLGQMVVIRWGNATYAPDWQATPQELWAKRPRHDKPELIASALEAALDAYLLKYLHGRAEQLAQLHGLSYRDIVLSNARTTWGTCRRDGLIRMNWRLVFLDAQLVDYVLAHELAHTVQMNHSPKFWQQVSVLCPDYLRLRKQMKQYDLRNT